jgi:hypothetical protein
LQTDAAACMANHRHAARYLRAVGFNRLTRIAGTAHCAAHLGGSAVVSNALEVLWGANNRRGATCCWSDVLRGDLCEHPGRVCRLRSLHVAARMMVHAPARDGRVSVAGGAWAQQGATGAA